MLTFFPSSFCSDSGRAITNAGRPPITKPGLDGRSGRAGA